MPTVHLATNCDDPDWDRSMLIYVPGCTTKTVDIPRPLFDTAQGPNFAPAAPPSMATLSTKSGSTLLADQHIAIVGRLASMAKRDAQQLIRQHGGTPIELGESE